MIPIGSFLGGLIVARFGADWAIALEGVAQILTAGYYFVIEKKKAIALEGVAQILTAGYYFVIEKKK